MNEIKDDTTEVIEETTPPDGDKAGENADEVADKKADEKGAPSDEDKKPDQAIQSVLDEYGLDSPEDLKGFLKNLSDLNNRVGDSDIEELKKKAATLDRYQKQWEKEEERKRQEDETPEETIARKNKENRELKKQLEAQKANRDEEEENTRLLQSFNKTVTSVVKATKDLPAEDHAFLSEFLGVNNEINEVDLADKAGIKRIAKASVKKLKEHNQRVIKRYLKGKESVPKITTSTETPSEEPKKITRKNVKAMALERFNRSLNK